MIRTTEFGLYKAKAKNRYTKMRVYRIYNKTLYLLIYINQIYSVIRS